MTHFVRFLAIQKHNWSVKIKIIWGREDGVFLLRSLGRISDGGGGCGHSLSGQQARCQRIIIALATVTLTQPNRAQASKPKTTGAPPEKQGLFSTQQSPRAKRKESKRDRSHKVKPHCEIWDSVLVNNATLSDTHFTFTNKSGISQCTRT